MNREPPSPLMRVSYGNTGVVELPGGEHRECRFRRAVGRPVCGDRVGIEETGGGTLVVSEILPRSNEFARADAQGRKQTIAANLDRVLIVVAPSPAPSRDLLERYLVAVHSLDIAPLIVVNKAELLAEAVPDPDSPLGRLDRYRALGYDVLETSCKGAPGTGALPPALESRTCILVGQSGVGKSSLANALLPDLALQTGELSRVTGKGTHTTTTTIMYDLPCGGRLIDSPGVWEYGLWPLTPQELEHGYVEFRPFLGGCRFNDCRHSSEPGCAIRAAVEAGDIHRWRYDSYLRLLRQAGQNGQ